AASALGLFFWPFFLPLLLAGVRTEAPPRGHSAAARRIQSAQAQLLAALSRAHGLAEEVLAPEIARIQGLTQSVELMESKAREMDELLATPEFNARAAQETLQDLQHRKVA